MIALPAAIPTWLLETKFLSTTVPAPSTAIAVTQFDAVLSVIIESGLSATLTPLFKLEKLLSTITGLLPCTLIAMVYR
jgi:hypothetical protein